MKRWSLLVVVGWVVVFAVGCSLENPSSSLGAASVDPLLVRGINGFGLRLLRDLRQGQGGNVFLSPVSVELALSMAASGARGETQREMYTALGFSPLSREEVNTGNLALLRALKISGSGVTLSLANSLWAREEIDFFPEYLETVRHFYEAEARIVDFASPQTIPLINQWVKEKTQGAIKDIISRLPDNTILVLLNATYFKGKWKTSFDPAKTQSLPFFSEGGGQKEVPMMWQEGSFSYLETESLQVVRLPYAQECFGMYIFLPKEREGVDALLGELDMSTLEGYIAALAEKEGEVYLPRFRVTFEKTLNEDLKTLGVEKAFDPERADFGDMLPVSPEANAYISEVKHKSLLEVNEEGTVAAGATSVIIGLTSVSPDYRFVMRVDHPFLVGIRDETTGVFLFLGVVADPEELS
ncbi:MAG: serpin family protein [Candidatus Caldatribacteriaceae bacterium]